MTLNEYARHNGHADVIRENDLRHCRRVAAIGRRARILDRMLNPGRRPVPSRSAGARQLTVRVLGNAAPFESRTSTISVGALAWSQRARPSSAQVARLVGDRRRVELAQFSTRTGQRQPGALESLWSAVSSSQPKVSAKAT